LSQVVIDSVSLQIVLLMRCMTCNVDCSGIAVALTRAVGQSTEAPSGSMISLVSLVW